MLRKTLFALSLVLSLCSFDLSFAADAKQAEKAWRIGYLGNSPLTNPQAADIWASFQRGLQDRGYKEGKNVAFEQRFAEGKPERYSELAAELVRLHVDVIVVASSDAAYAVKAATATIPIVMVAVADPVGRGLIKSLAHPDGNVTGIASLSLDLIPKRLEQLKDTLPTASRVAFIRCLKCVSRDSPADEAARKSVWVAAAKTLGLALSEIDLSDPADFEAATAALLRVHPHAVLLGQNPVNYLLREQLADFALRQRLPLFAPTREQVTAGGLMSYGPTLSDQFREAAIYVDKILRGAKPGDLPVEQPTRFNLVINHRTAETLGLSIPQSMRQQVDEWI